MNSLKKIAISDIKQRSYNPASRVSRRNLVGLIKSIEKLGLIYPVAVTKTMDLIDGHRRLAACRELGWDTIPALIVQSEETAETIYGDINAHGKPLSGAQNLQVWLKEPSAVSERARTLFESAEEKFGRRLLQRLAREGMSASVLKNAAYLARYVGSEEDLQFVRLAAKWLIEHRLAIVVRSYIELKQPPKTLYQAVKTNRDLRATFAAK